MTDEVKKVRSHHPGRIVLSPEALDRVNAWIDHVTPHMKGNTFTRSDLVSWLLVNRSSDLSAVEIEGLTKAFFDPMKALAWASRQITERQLAGETVDVAAFMSEVLSTKTKAARKRSHKLQTPSAPQEP